MVLVVQIEKIKDMFCCFTSIGRAYNIFLFLNNFNILIIPLINLYILCDFGKLHVQYQFELYCIIYNISELYVTQNMFTSGKRNYLNDLV